MKSFNLRLVCLILVLMTTGVHLRAADRRPLPEFLLTGLDGQTAKSVDLAGKANWLLIYVNKKSHFCDELLAGLKRDQYPTLAAKTLIVVQGSVDDAKGLQSKYPDLATASWYVDSSRDAFGQLQLHGVPVILGLQDQTIEWTINGILPDGKTFKSILNSWIQ